MRVRAWQLRKFSFGQILIFSGLLVLAVGSNHPAHAQGVATGGTAVPARPLPAEMKAPAVEYRDIASQAGLTGVDISGPETSKQYIVETTGNGVAIFDLGVTKKGRYRFRVLSDQLPELGPHGPQPYLFSLPFNVE